MGLIARGLGGVVTVGALLLCAAAPASAVTYQLSIEVPKKDGLSMSVGIEKSSAELVVVQSSKRTLSTAYFRHRGLRSGLRPNGRVNANLGSQGSVRGRFVDSRGAPQQRDRCTRGVIFEGFFVGRIELRGGPGLPVVRRHRLPAAFERSKRVRCSEPIHSRARDVGLIACNRDSGALYAAGEEGFAGENTVLHYAYSAERLSKKVTVARNVIADGPRKSFRVTPDLLGATTTPPPPFSGSATFANGKLTGDLSVEFLGLSEPVAIAPGPAFIDDGTSDGDLEPPCHVLGQSARLAALPAG